MNFENQNFEQKINSQKVVLESYLSSELKLQDEIKNKIQDENLSKLAKKELKEILQRFENNLNSVNNKYKKEKFREKQNSVNNRKDLLTELKSSFVVKDLVDDFREDLKWIDKIEEELKDYDWYNEFKWLLVGNELSESEKEKIIDLVSNNSIEDIFPSDFWDISLPSSLDDIKAFIKEKKFKLNIENKEEIKEILESQFENDNLEELNYKKTKLLELKENKIWENLTKNISKKILELDLQINLKQEKEEVKQEKEEVKQEKEEVKQEKEKIDNYISNILKEINILKQKNFPFEKKLDNLLTNFENAKDSTESIKIAKEIANYFTSWWLKTFLETAQKSWEEIYKSAYSFVESVVKLSWSEILSQAIKNYPNPNFSLKHIDAIPYNEENSIVSTYFWDTWWFFKEGDIFTRWDTKIDLSKEPPEIFVFNENTGYNLKLKNDFSQEVDKISREKQSLFSETINLRKQEINLQKSLEKLNLLESDESKMQALAEKTGKSVLEIKQKLQSEKIKLQQKLTELRDNLKSVKEKYLLVSNWELSEKIAERREKQKKILEFLSKIGFDLMPQDITDDIIHMINSSEWLKSKFWFTSNIDIANWNLWINKDMDMSKISFAEKQAFSRFVNKMITGNENYPFSLSTMWLQFFKSESDMKAWKVASAIDRQAYVNKRLWANPKWKILQNLWIVNK